MTCRFFASLRMTLEPVFKPLEHLREVPGQQRVDALVGDDDALVLYVERHSARLPDDPVRSAELPQWRRVAVLRIIPHTEVAFFGAQLARPILADDHQR